VIFGIIGSLAVISMESTDQAQAFKLGVIPTRLFMPFGGKVTSDQLEFCLIRMPPPIFFIPYPFLYIEVGEPSPATLYFLWGIPGTPLQPSKLFKNYELWPPAWSLGTYMPYLDDAFRKICWNGPALPDADGVIRYVGTSSAGDVEGAMTAAGAGLAQPVFKASDFPQFCDPASPAGTCQPKK